MDRKGQTWCAAQHDVVFVVLKSREKREGFWAHDVVFLENGSAPHLTGTKGELLESQNNEFDSFLTRLT